MDKKLMKRFYASKGGAGVMFFAYIAVVLILSYMEKTYYDMSTLVGYLIVPAAYFMDVTAESAAWFGVSNASLFASLLIYVMIGFVIDYFYKPME